MWIAVTAVFAIVSAYYLTGLSDTDPHTQAGAQVDRQLVAYQPVDINVPPSQECIMQVTCLRQFYQNVTWQVGPTKAIEVLEAHGRTNAVLEEQCHDTTHAIGEVASRMEVLSAAMERGDETCGSGYVHGVIATFLTKFDPADVVSVLVDACAVPGDDVESSFRRWECYHGVGHGFVFNASGEIQRAISSCATIVVDSDRGACASGAFMQELVDNGTNEELYGADPYAACRPVKDAVMLGQCFDMHAVIVYQLRDSDADRFAVCDSLPTENRPDCWSGLGRALFAGMPLEAERSVEFCGAARLSGGFDACFDGVVSNTASYYGSGAEAATHCPEFTDAALEAACVEILERRWGTGSMAPPAASNP